MHKYEKNSAEIIGNRKGTIHYITNENGHRLCQLPGTLITFLTIKFEHQRKHKVTWKQPAGHIEHHIDYILATKGIDRKTADKNSGHSKNNKLGYTQLL